MSEKATEPSVIPVEELVLLGDQLMQRGRHKQAALTYETALASDPTSRSAALGKAAALISLGDLQGGEDLLSGIQHESLADPTETRRYAFWLAYLAAEKGEHEKALGLVDEWLARLDHHGKGRLLVLAARSLIHLGKPGEGTERLREAWAFIDRNDRPSVMWLANVAFLSRAFDVSARGASTAFRIQPRLAPLFLNLFSRWYRLKPAVRVVAALVLLVFIFIPTWGVYVFAGVEGLLLVAAIAGWRTKTGSLVVSALGTGGGLLVAYLLFVLYRALS